MSNLSLDHLKDTLNSTYKRWPTNAELGDLRHGFETAITRIEKLEAAIERVRDVHKPMAHFFMPKYCQCGQTIPCRTAQALRDSHE